MNPKKWLCWSMLRLLLLGFLISVLAERPQGADKLKSVTWCEDGRHSDAACGGAIQKRTQFNNDLCQRVATLEAGNTTLSKALQGAVLDILLVPSEDETLWIEPGEGEPYWGGIVGEALAFVASEGDFEWNALVVGPPHEGDAYGGSWDLWMLDWTNRVDFIAAWMYDKPSRRTLQCWVSILGPYWVPAEKLLTLRSWVLGTLGTQPWVTLWPFGPAPAHAEVRGSRLAIAGEEGISFPYSFYDLSPVLLVVESSEKATMSFASLFSFFIPFSWELWGVLCGLFLIVGLLDGLVVSTPTRARTVSPLSVFRTRRGSTLLPSRSPTVLTLLRNTHYVLMRRTI